MTYIYIYLIGKTGKSENSNDIDMSNAIFTIINTFDTFFFSRVSFFHRDGL